MRGICALSLMKKYDILSQTSCGITTTYKIRPAPFVEDAAAWQSFGRRLDPAYKGRKKI